ncbi:damage-inducible protein DinB [Dyadobacter sp. LJ53]|uniref:DinB family protein n=1 Tax=Dyadobacter chenwenxiniae TaxID=2906456 RepID=UPI001F421724|nr:DinB family protein [Dyadobacter chenwenxiniae]MCF0048933.1 damage-inducible protein DinB [Dyadobacter chenwenxiniae]
MENKLFANAYIQELEAEYTSTRKCLERIPETSYNYKPHPKSMEMGYLTLLVAEIPLWVAVMVEEGEIDFVTFKHMDTREREAVVRHYDENIERAKAALQNATEEDLAKEFRLKNKGELLYAQPMVAAIGSTINHWVHHRGQLTVYMRLNDIAVPSIYGPSADDKGFS